MSSAEPRAGHGQDALPAKTRQPVGKLDGVTAKLFMLLAGGAIGSSWIHRSSALKSVENQQPFGCAAPLTKTLRPKPPQLYGVRVQPVAMLLAPRLQTMPSSSGSSQ